jgi:hypothetical protein
VRSVFNSVIRLSLIKQLTFSFRSCLYIITMVLPLSASAVVALCHSFCLIYSVVCICCLYSLLVIFYFDMIYCMYFATMYLMASCWLIFICLIAVLVSSTNCFMHFLV